MSDVKLLNLANNNLKNNNSSKLIKSLAKLPNCLNVSNNLIGIKGCETLSRSIETKNKLK